jgi:hypothetical protein
MNKGLIGEYRDPKALFTDRARGLVPPSGGGTTTFLRADGTFAPTPGGSGSSNVGTAILDFGAFPGSSHATVAVIGQAAIIAGSVVEAWLRPVATADHSADEHMLETLDIFAADIVAGVGFTIHGFNKSQIFEREPLQLLIHQGQSNLGSPRQAGQWPAGYSEGRGTRIYGQWTIAWEWN